MTPFLLVALALLLLAASGDGLLRLLRVPARNPLDRAVFSFGAGVAVAGTWSLLLAIAGVRATTLLLALPLLLIPAGRVFVRPGGAASTSPTGGRPASSAWSDLRLPPLAIAALVATLAQLLFAFRQATLRPVFSWDAWRIWSFRAKVLFLERGFPEGFFSGDWAGFPGYPLGIPFVEAWLAHAARSWHEPAIKTLFPLFLGGVFVAACRLIEERSGRRAASIGVLLLAASPLLVYHGTVAYMDLPLAFFLLAAVLALARWERGEGEGWLAAAAVVAGFLPQVKNEGLPLYLLLTGIALARRGEKPLGRTLARWALLSLPFSLPWLLFKYLGGVPESPYHVLASPGIGGLLGRLADLARLVPAAMFLTGSFGIAWFVLLFFFIPKRSRRTGIPELALAGGAIVFALAYLFTDSHAFLLNGTALGRNLLVLTPLGVTAGLSALFGILERGHPSPGAAGESNEP
jgi:hypothetical protein